MNKINLLLEQLWQPMLIGLILAVATFGLLFIHLGSRPLGLSLSELTTHNISKDLHSILKDPVNSPLTIPEHFFIKIRPHGIAASRGVSAIYGVIILILIFFILRFWQDTFTATIGTVIFGTSGWFLHTSRLDTPAVLFFGVIAILATGLWLKHTLHRNIVALISALVIGSCIYIPGLIWFVLAGVIWTRRSVINEWRHINKITKIASLIIFILLLIPLVRALILQPSLVWQVLGFPSHIPHIKNFLHNIASIGVQIFIRGPLDPVRWLGRTPILNVFEDAMFLIGAYSFWLHRKLYRAQLVCGSLILGVFLVSLGGPVTITILIPLVYIVIAAGIFYMLEVWHEVFPHNPVARAFGKALLVIVVAISCNYHLQSYFVAWQNSPNTHAVFTKKP